MQSSAESAKVLFPESAQPDDMLAVVLTNARGEHSAPIYVNRVEPWWWIGGEADTAYAGEPLELFGKNSAASCRCGCAAGERLTSWRCSPS